MKNFGKFTAHNENIDIGNGEQASVIIFRDVNGVDWFELAAQFPHPWYIVVDDNSVIVSMEESHESTQIAGYTIIGIDSNFGYTRGPGGTVYGKIWDGSAIVEPPVELPPLETWRIDAALQLRNETWDVAAKIATLPVQQRVVYNSQWRNKGSFERADDLVVNGIMVWFSISSPDMDDIWNEGLAF